MGVWSFLKEGFSTSYIPSYILFAFNVLLMFNLRSVYNIAKNISNKLEYKAKVKEDIENISSRVTNTVKISEEMFYEDGQVVGPTFEELPDEGEKKEDLTSNKSTKEFTIEIPTNMSKKSLEKLLKTI